MGPAQNDIRRWGCRNSTVHTIQRNENNERAAGHSDAKRSNQLASIKLIFACFSMVCKKVPEQSERSNKPSKPSLLGFDGFLLCSAVRFARCVDSAAGLVRERRQAQKLFGGKSRNNSGVNAALFGSFSGSEKESLRKKPSTENPAASTATAQVSLLLSLTQRK